MLTTPRINSFTNSSSIDATLNNVFTFTSIGGDLVYKNELTITDMSNVTVYNKILTTYSLSHTVVASSLQNNKTYKAIIRTYNQAGLTSAWSDWFIFSCYTTPTISFTNVSGIITSESYVFMADYHQFEGMDCKYYKFVLYDENKIIVETSSTLTDDLFEYHITGLENDTNYYVEFQATSTTNAVCTTGLVPITVLYADASTGKILSAICNEQDGLVDLSLKVVDAKFAIDEGTISYYDNSWIDLTQGSIYTDTDLGFLLSDEQWSVVFRVALNSDGYIFRIIGDESSLSLRKDGIYMVFEYEYNGTTFIIEAKNIGDTFIGDEYVITLQKYGINLQRNIEIIASERIALIRDNGDTLISSNGDTLLITREGEIKSGRN